tara:strand:+ start:361 stop:897 length:537 start_codon:yes stop_codon:yes gene_type:complete
MEKNVKQLLPKGSREIIIKALKCYQHSLKVIGAGFDDNMNSEDFDCYGLIGMMNYDVEISLPEKDKENFFHLEYNVDFPIFDKVSKKYPTEVSNYTIKKNVFLEWYFKDQEVDYTEVGEIIVKKLIEQEGKQDVSFNVMTIFQSCNHEVVPVSLTEECEGFGDTELGELNGDWNLTLI